MGMEGQGAAEVSGTGACHKWDSSPLCLPKPKP